MEGVTTSHSKLVNVSRNSVLSKLGLPVQKSFHVESMWF